MISTTTFKDLQPLKGVKIGFALTGSFCNFDIALQQAEHLVLRGAELIPIMSQNASTIDTRFGKASQHIERIEGLCGKKIISTIAEAEPIGPRNMTDIILVCPCTGNTMAKLARSITDTAVTMAVKSHIRNTRPVILCIASNDALAGSAKNIGILMNLKSYYFVPMSQDDTENKPTSLVADFSLTEESIIQALSGKQIQPVIR